MQKQIGTKLVRKIVRGIANNAIYNYSYTDKTKEDNNLRHVSFFIDSRKAEQVKKDLEFVLFSAGYNNKVKVTTSNYDVTGRCGGNTYLRINNCVLD